MGTIHSNIEHLNSKLAEAQEAKQDLLAIKHKLEQVMMVILMSILMKSKGRRNWQKVPQREKLVKTSAI